jgi:ribosome assembly protein YihI (activator of Der GTPase)
MASLTLAETRAFVEKLLVTGNGDPGRLTYILNLLKQNRPLYNSDQKYLDAKFAQELGMQEKLKVEDDILTKIQKLVSSGNGDTGRLQFILEFLKQGKTLYRSDQQYLESKLGQKINYTDIAPKQDSN